jgi:CubicO group peptidase (beta-lactamase class C family)
LRFVTLSGLIAVIALAAAGAPVSDPHRSDAYSAYVESARAEWGTPGLAVAVIADGRVALVRGFGVRERGGSAPIDADTVFPIASPSKGFTAAAIGTLVAEGKLSWDDRVTELLPGFVLADPWVTRASGPPRPPWRRARAMASRHVPHRLG